MFTQILHVLIVSTYIYVFAVCENEFIMLNKKKHTHKHIELFKIMIEKNT